jgi:hypothetical protein
MSTDREKNSVFSNPITAPTQVQQAPQQAPRDELDLDVPVDIAPLPSRGLIYPVGSAFCDAEGVQICAMTTREEDILTNRAYLKQGTVINEVIKSCLLEKSFNTLDLIVGDRNAILVAVRVTGYGAEYEAEVECEECNAKLKNKFNLSTLGVKNLKITPVEDHVNLFEYTLPKARLGGQPVVVRFKFMTSKDELEASQIKEKQVKLGLQQAGTVSGGLATVLQSVNGVTDKAKISRFISKLSPADSLALRKYIVDNEPGIDMKQDYVCAACGHTNEVTIPLGSSFLWPNA